MRIAVIGGGVIGLSCAWRLAQGGAAVELFEARACGQGATLGALGALWPASPLADGPLQRLHRASLWQFDSFVGGLTALAGPVTFARRGRLELLNSEKAAARARQEVQTACAAWPALGGDKPVMEVLDSHAIAAGWPHIAPAAIQYGGVVCRATAQVHVGELVSALRRVCELSNVTICEHEPIVSLEISGNRVTGVRSAMRMAAADGVLIAAGAWSTQLWPQGGAVAAVIRPAKGQGLALQMPAGLVLEGILKAEKSYLIPWPEAGEILVGSTTEPEAGFDEAPTEQGRQTLLARVQALVPALRGMPVLRHWAGLRPQNPAKRHPPIMGPHPAIANLYLCAGHFKTGIGLAPRVSELMAGMMLRPLEAIPPELQPFVPGGAARQV